MVNFPLPVLVTEAPSRVRLGPSHLLLHHVWWDVTLSGWGSGGEVGVADLIILH